MNIPGEDVLSTSWHRVRDAGSSVGELAGHTLSNNALVRSLPRVDAPVQVFKSRTDAVVPPTSLALLRKGLGGNLGHRGRSDAVSAPHRGADDASLDPPVSRP